MKRKRVRAVLACLAGTVFLCGCTTAPYQLTEQEESIIVSYASHVVSKYNIYQGDGLVYVRQEEESEAVEEIADTELPLEEEENESNPVSGASGEGAVDAAAEAVDINAVFGAENLHISFQGNEIRKSYVEDSVYAVDASAGKNYLVLNFDITNVGDSEIMLDIMSQNPKISVRYLDEEGTEKNAVEAVTFLTNDLSTYEGVIAAGESSTAVLLFEIPESTSLVSELVLKVRINEKNYKINL